MLQPSQLTNSFLFLSFSILLIAIFVPIFLWGLRKKISDMQKSPNFTDQDVIAIRRQMLTLLVGIPLLLLSLALPPLIWDQPPPNTVFIALIIGFAPLAYIAMSSIRNRVSIGRGSLPTKGTQAVWSGVINLVFIVVMFTGLAIYFASLLHSK
jgi:hypothetical protein